MRTNPLRQRIQALALVAAAIGWGAPSTGALEFVSVKDEIAIGKRANAEVRRQTPEVRDSVVASYMSQLGRQLAAQAGGPRYPYTFDVANYREINAFALPGGPVWIHRGTLEAAQNESQLASVIAHEIAHIAHRHAASRLTKATAANVGLGVLGAFLGEGRGSRIAQIGASLAAQTTMAKFSRDDERAADLAGLRYMRRAGFDTRGAAEFMQILRAEGGRDPGAVQVFFASHPAPAERVTRLRQASTQIGRGSRRDSPAFQAAKRRLARLGPAASMRSPRS